MGRSRKSDWEPKERKIFLILFEEEKQFYLNDSMQKRSWTYYDTHYRERNSITCDLFRRCKAAGKLPPMYHIDTIFGTSNDAFQRKIAWSLYLSSLGYETLMGENMKKILAETDPEMFEDYAAIKDIPFSTVCDSNKNLAAEFRNSSKRKRTSRSQVPDDYERISFLVRKEEYRLIKVAAETQGVPMSEFIVENLRLGSVLQVDTSFLESYTREAIRIQKLLRGLYTTYLVHGQYFPSDMRLMQDLCAQTMECYNGAAEEMRRLCRRLSRMKKGPMHDSKTENEHMEEEYASAPVPERHTDE